MLFSFLSRDWPQVTFCYFCFLSDDRNKRWQVLQIIWSITQIKSPLLRIVTRTVFFLTTCPDTCCASVLMMELLLLGVLENRRAQSSLLRIYPPGFTALGMPHASLGLKGTQSLWSWTVVRLLYRHGPLSPSPCETEIQRWCSCTRKWLRIATLGLTACAGVIWIRHGATRPVRPHKPSTFQVQWVSCYGPSINCWLGTEPKKKHRWTMLRERFKTSLLTFVSCSLHNTSLHNLSHIVERWFKWTWKTTR